MTVRHIVAISGVVSEISARVKRELTDQIDERIWIADEALVLEREG